MSRRTPRPAPALLAVALVLTVVAASVALVVRLTGDDDDTTTAGPAPASTAPPTTTAPDPGTSAPPETGTADGSNLSPDQRRTVDELKEQVADIRGLEWKGDLPVRIVSPDELARRIQDLTNIERQKDPDADQDLEDVLKLLQLIPDDLDFSATIDKLLAGGVLGFYDDEAKELFVGGDPDDDLDVATKSTMVHELVHALTDQHFDFGARNRELSDKELSEEAFALSALIEGDAELVRTIWSDEHLSSREQLEAELGGDTGDPSVYLDMPPYILNSLFFPYLNGTQFVSALHDEGGFGAVNTAYGQPPTSSEEIMHPELYQPGRTWARPPIPDLATATGCTDIDTGTVGEFDMTQVLDHLLPEAEAARAAAGWNGDAYGLVRCGTVLGMADRWRTDGAGDLTELHDALNRWAQRWSGSSELPAADGRFTGPAGSGRIIRSPDRIDLVIAGDASTSDRLIAAVLAA